MLCGNTEEWRRQLENARTRPKPPILSCLRMKVRWLINELECLFHMHVVVCASICEFQDRNSIKGGRM